jgi:two-component system, cell cycle sensor histidine kinase and response regulator CckA
MMRAEAESTIEEESVPETLVGQDALERRLEMEQTLVAISTRFVQPDDFDDALARTLEDIGRLTGADRTYLYLSAENGSWGFHTYEWCAADVEPHRPNLRGMPSDAYPWWARQLEQGDPIYFDNLRELPWEARSNSLADDAVSHSSLLIFPVRANSRLLGCIGLDNSWLSPARQREDTAMLRVVAHIVAKALQQRQTEEALAHQEAFLRHVVDVNPHLIFAKDREGRFTLVNKAVGLLFGIDPEDMLGKTDADFNPNAEQVESFRRVDLEVLDSQQETVVAEEAITDCRGRRRWLYTIKRPVLDGSSQLDQVLGVSTDITHLKEIEDALKRSEAYFRGIFDNTSIGIAISNVSDCRFYDANTALQAMVGLGLADLRRLTWSDLIVGEERQRFMDQKRHLCRGSRSAFQIELRLRHQAENVVWGNLAGSLIRDHEGQPQYLVVTVEDITQRKQAEADNEKLQAQFLQAQKMEALGRLTAGIAHDFNNLLTAINGFAEITRGRLRSDDPLRDLVERISRAGWHAADLVNQLLVFSRKETGQPQVLDLNNVVREIDAMLQRIIGEDIDLVTLLDADLWPVKVDPAQLEQVIVNLAVNARDAMPDGGKLTIETSNQVLDVSYARSHFKVNPGDYVLLVVSDTGIGMSAEVQARIFEPFFTTKGSSKGTGLGLATVYGIVENSQGHIWVYSEPGYGTTFKIYLPRTAEVFAGAAVGPDHTVSHQGKETILLLEDNAGVRELTQWLLQEQGYTVVSAAAAEEAEKVFRAHEGPIHLLLTDVVIPDTNGVALAQSLRALKPTLKVLYMSGYTDDTIQRLGVLEEGVAFIRKPFNPSALAEKVRDVLDG